MKTTLALCMLCCAVCADDVKPFDFIAQEQLSKKIAPAPAPQLREEVLVGAREDSRDIKIASLETENAQLRMGKNELQRRIDELEKVPLLELHGLSKLQASAPSAQVVVTTTESCQPCKILIDNLKARLIPQGYTVSEEATAEIRIVKITEADWIARGIRLPLVELYYMAEKPTTIFTRDPYEIGRIYNRAVEDGNKAPKAADTVTGLSIAKVSGKEQVTQMLALIEPFLDGGTLNLTYTPKPGVVKDYLTIKRGAGGIKIPAKTSLSFTMKGGDLTIKCNDPKPIIIAGPLERGVQEVDITPNKLSIRLPWMIDPELTWKK